MSMFRDREEAAYGLVEKLARYKDGKGIVMAIPRGGIPVGAIVAKKLNLPLEPLMIKKIGHPQNKEFAIGAVSLQGDIVDDSLDIPEGYLDKEIEKIRDKLKERYKRYTGNGDPLDVKGKTVILIDDGIATGYTIRAAINIMRQRKAGKIVVAAPVVPFRTAERLKEMSDEFITLAEPVDFYAVGQFYEDFGEVTDDDVMKLIKK